MHDCLEWEDARKGRFRILDSDTLARRWGDYRQKEAMNYDKMSRAMRFYYRRRILDKTARRLHYKFTESIMKQVEAVRSMRDSDGDESEGDSVFAEYDSGNESDESFASEMSDESD